MLGVKSQIREKKKRKSNQALEAIVNRRAVHSASALTFGDRLMKKDKQWYLAWTPGRVGYDRDDSIIAVGLKCKEEKPRLSDALSWLGAPDRVSGNAESGHLAYFFHAQTKTAALFTVTHGRLDTFGTITRSASNSTRTDSLTGKESTFNILNEMDPFTGSEMEESTEPGH